MVMKDGYLVWYLPQHQSKAQAIIAQVQSRLQDLQILPATTTGNSKDTPRKIGQEAKHIIPPSAQATQHTFPYMPTQQDGDLSPLPDTQQALHL